MVLACIDWRGCVDSGHSGGHCSTSVEVSGPSNTCERGKYDVNSCCFVQERLGSSRGH